MMYAEVRGGVRDRAEHELDRLDDLADNNTNSTIKHNT